METKRIHCPIHGFITLTDVMIQIIDTPEFQRLRDLKQLGAASYVYPSATHTRFAHSLGVSHLAGKAVESLQKAQTNLQISERDVELFRIAGLIHDIGHGPFSHLYDDPMIRLDEPEHEERGCQLFREMVEKYNIRLTPNEVETILDMVNPDDTKKHLWQCQIIANKISQVDVDKIDYIRRDCYHLGLTYCNNNEFSRLITDLRVCKVGDKQKLYIAWPKKLQYEIYALFSTRYRLHKEVYTHHTVRAYEIIIKKILINIKRSRPNFLELTDSVVSCLLHSNNKHLQQMIATRNIPKLVKDTGDIVIDDDNITLEKVKNVFKNKDYYIDQIKIGFVSGDVDNPLENIYYYNNKSTESPMISACKVDPYKNSFMVTKSYREIILRIYELPTGIQS